PRLLLATAAAGCLTVARPLARQTEALDRIPARIDPYVDKRRVIVMTDIANEPDDQMSMVRFLVYTTDFDVEGLIATTSTWMKHTVRPDVIRTVLDAYSQVRPRLSEHAQGFPTV